MTVIAGTIYRYVVRLPYTTNEQRPAWPLGVHDAIDAVQDVADVTFGDDVCAWQGPEAIRIESRRQRIEVITVSATAAGAEAARVALFAELERQRAAAGIPRLIIARDTVEGATLP